MYGLSNDLFKLFFVVCCGGCKDSNNKSNGYSNAGKECEYTWFHMFHLNLSEKYKTEYNTTGRRMWLVYDGSLKRCPHPVLYWSLGPQCCHVNSGKPAVTTHCACVSCACLSSAAPCEGSSRPLGPAMCPRRLQAGREGENFQ